MNRIGPTGRTIAENLARLRKERGYTTTQLAAMMDAYGFAITATSITKTELCQRKVEAEELFIFSIALDVNPSALYGPPTQDCTLEVSGLKKPISGRKLWDWLDGLMPLGRSHDDGSAYADFQLRARPEGRRKFRA